MDTVPFFKPFILLSSSLQAIACRAFSFGSITTLPNSTLSDRVCSYLFLSFSHMKCFVSAYAQSQSRVSDRQNLAIREYVLSHVPSFSCIAPSQFCSRSLSSLHCTSPQLSPLPNSVLASLLSFPFSSPTPSLPILCSSRLSTFLPSLSNSFFPNLCSTVSLTFLSFFLLNSPSPHPVTRPLSPLLLHLRRANFLLPTLLLLLSPRLSSFTMLSIPSLPLNLSPSSLPFPSMSLQTPLPNSVLVPLSFSFLLLSPLPLFPNFLLLVSSPFPSISSPPPPFRLSSPTSVLVSLFPSHSLRNSLFPNSCVLRSPLLSFHSLSTPLSLTSVPRLSTFLLQLPSNSLFPSSRFLVSLHLTLLIQFPLPPFVPPRSSHSRCHAVTLSIHVVGPSHHRVVLNDLVILRLSFPSILPIPLPAFCFPRLSLSSILSNSLLPHFSGFLVSFLSFPFSPIPLPGFSVRSSLSFLPSLQPSLFPSSSSYSSFLHSSLKSSFPVLLPVLLLSSLSPLPPPILVPSFYSLSLLPLLSNLLLSLSSVVLVSSSFPSNSSISISSPNHCFSFRSTLSSSISPSNSPTSSPESCYLVLSPSFHSLQTLFPILSLRLISFLPFSPTPSSPILLLVLLLSFHSLQLPFPQFCSSSLSFPSILSNSLFPILFLVSLLSFHSLQLPLPNSVPRLSPFLPFSSNSLFPNSVPRLSPFLPFSPTPSSQFCSSSLSFPSILSNSLFPILFLVSLLSFHSLQLPLPQFCSSSLSFPSILSNSLFPNSVPRLSLFPSIPRSSSLSFPSISPTPSFPILFLVSLLSFSPTPLFQFSPTPSSPIRSSSLSFPSILLPSPNSVPLSPFLPFSPTPSFPNSVPRLSLSFHLSNSSSPIVSQFSPTPSSPILFLVSLLPSILSNLPLPHSVPRSLSFLPFSPTPSSFCSSSLSFRNSVSSLSFLPFSQLPSPQFCSSSLSFPSILSNSSSFCSSSLFLSFHFSNSLFLLFSSLSFPSILSNSLFPILFLVSLLPSILSNSLFQFCSSSLSFPSILSNSSSPILFLVSLLSFHFSPTPFSPNSVLVSLLPSILSNPSLQFCSLSPPLPPLLPLSLSFLSPQLLPQFLVSLLSFHSLQLPLPQFCSSSLSFPSILSNSLFPNSVRLSLSFLPFSPTPSSPILFLFCLSLFLPFSPNSLFPNSFLRLSLSFHSLQLPLPTVPRLSPSLPFLQLLSPILPRALLAFLPFLSTLLPLPHSVPTPLSHVLSILTPTRLFSKFCSLVLSPNFLTFSPPSLFP
ncbi:hypothetical protein C7M84_022735 [Penaeus vannamei]|uniref:Uncharacterized protein n=1 Tax=Penaeus vannamei TaxID=6689 RepID=A0A423U5T4_PENVA|nr:hypothetical protein C7M84_022735 [Penaeus vannamei]